MESPNSAALGEADLSAITPREFAELVKQVSRAELDEIMAEPDVRTKILDEVFSRMHQRFRGTRGDSVVHWKILDRPGGGYDLYQISMSGKTCTVSKESASDPRVTLSLSGAEFLRLASGNASPTTLFFRGKIKLAGDIGFAAGLTKLFDIPKP
jgi:putative sterol carrier protein